MPDGKRKRRHSLNNARRDWYARFRSFRFQRRFGLPSMPFSSDVLGLGSVAAA